LQKVSDTNVSSISRGRWVSFRLLSQGRRKRFSNCKHGFAISRLEAPEVCLEFPHPLIQRAQGMPDARRVRSRVRSVVTHALVTTVTPETSGIPRAMVLTVSFVLSPVTGLSCHRHP